VERRYGQITFVNVPYGTYRRAPERLGGGKKSRAAFPTNLIKRRKNNSKSMSGYGKGAKKGKGKDQKRDRVQCAG